MTHSNVIYDDRLTKARPRVRLVAAPSPARAEQLMHQALGSDDGAGL